MKILTKDKSIISEAKKLLIVHTSAENVIEYITVNAILKFGFVKERY